MNLTENRRHAMASTSREEPLRYYNERGRLVVDMRKEG